MNFESTGRWCAVLLLACSLSACGSDARVEKLRADVAECQLELNSKGNELDRCNSEIAQSVEKIAKNLESVLDSAGPEAEAGSSEIESSEADEALAGFEVGPVRAPPADLESLEVMSRQISVKFVQLQESSERLERQVRRLRRQVADTGSMTGEKIDVVRGQTEDISERVDRSDQLNQQIRSLERQLGTLHQDILRRTDAVAASVRDFDAGEINCRDCGWFGNKKLRDQVTGFHNELLDQLDALPDLDWFPVTEDVEMVTPGEADQIGPPT